MIKGLDLIAIVVWCVAGSLTLSRQKISRTDYTLVWLMLVITLICKYIGG